MEPVTTVIATKVASELSAPVRESGTSFLKTVLHTPGEAIAGLLADVVNERRHANLIKIAARATERLHKAGVSPVAVPLSIIHPALEGASLEEDPDLQTIWSNLLANAADPRQRNGVAPSFPAILKELTSREVRFLDAIYIASEEACSKPSRRGTRIEEIRFGWAELIRIFSTSGLGRYRFDHDYVSARDADQPELKADDRDMKFSLGVLQRQSLIVTEYIMPAVVVDPRKQPQTYELDSADCFSHLGVCFVQACREPAP